MISAADLDALQVATAHHGIGPEASKNARTSSGGPRREGHVHVADPQDSEGCFTSGVIGFPSAALLRDRQDRETHRQIAHGRRDVHRCRSAGNIVARFELVGTEETPVAGHAGRARRGRSSALRELVRLIYERTKFSPAAFADERSAVSVPSPKSIPRQTRSSTDRSAPSGLYEGSSRPGSAAEPAGDRPQCR